MKIGMKPHKDSSNINNPGIGDIRLSSNIYYFLKLQGYDVGYVPHTASENCDIYLDVTTYVQCLEVTAKRHVHFSFWSQNMEARPYNRVCMVHKNPAMVRNEDDLSMIATCYRRSFEQDKAKAPKLIPVFMPFPYPDELLPQAVQVPGFERTCITWGIRRCYYNDYSRTYSDNLLKALLRLNKKVDFTINFIDYPDHTSQGEHLVNQFKDAKKLPRIPWNAVLDIQMLSKLTLYHDRESGASTNEAMFCGGVPMFPADNDFWYVPAGVGSPKSEQELYETIEQLWFDKQLYQKHWEHYQDAFSEHRSSKLSTIWKDTLEMIMDTPAKERY